MIKHQIIRSYVPQLAANDSDVDLAAYLETADDIRSYLNKRNTENIFVGALVTLVPSNKYTCALPFNQQHPISKLSYVCKFFNNPNELTYYVDPKSQQTGCGTRYIPAVLQVMDLSTDLKPDSTIFPRPDILEGYRIVHNHGLDRDALQSYIKAQIDNRRTT